MLAFRNIHMSQIYKKFELYKFGNPEHGTKEKRRKLGGSKLYLELLQHIVEEGIL